MSYQERETVARMTAEQAEKALEAAKADGWMLGDMDTSVPCYYKGEPSNTPWIDENHLVCMYAKPEVDMPVTMNVGSDDYPGVITRVAKRFVLVRHTDRSGARSHREDEQRFNLCDDGVYRKSTAFLTIGRADHYMDPGF